MLGSLKKREECFTHLPFEKSCSEYHHSRQSTKSTNGKITISKNRLDERTYTTAQAKIPEGFRNETELIFHHEIVRIVEKHSISDLLIINMDQIP